MQNSSNESIKCANHNENVVMVVLDESLGQNERLLCSQCLSDFETNKKTMGFIRAQQIIQDNHQRNFILKENLINYNIKQLEQLNGKVSQLKSFLNKELDEMIGIIMNWINDLRKTISQQQYNFSQGLDQLIQNKLKIENDQIAEDLKSLNKKLNTKLKSKLEQFKTFKEYQDCQQILNNISIEKNQVEVNTQKIETQNLKIQNPPNLTWGHIKQQQNQQQQQYFKQFLAQKQAEIRYYVYQDLQNLINLMYSRRAVLEQFKNEPNHPMITLSNNKLILQLNLSNTIHTDLNQQCTNNYELKQTLSQERNNAFGILKKVIDKEKEEQLKINNKQVNSLDPQLQHYKKQYEYQKFDLNQLKLQETGLVAQFEVDVLDKIVSASQAVDSQIVGLRYGSTFNIPTEAEFIRKAENYYKLTQQKLTQFLD